MHLSSIGVTCIGLDRDAFMRVPQAQRPILRFIRLNQGNHYFATTTSLAPSSIDTAYVLAGGRTGFVATIFVGKCTFPQERQYVPCRLNLTASTAPSCPSKLCTSCAGKFSVGFFCTVGTRPDPLILPDHFKQRQGLPFSRSEKRHVHQHTAADHPDAA